MCLVDERGKEEKACLLAPEIEEGLTRCNRREASKSQLAGYVEVPKKEDGRLGIKSLETCLDKASDHTQ